MGCGLGAADDEPIATVADPVTNPQAPAPRSYTPKHLAERILTSRSAMEGARKHVTVLFADVKESMSLSEEVDPEEWHTILDEFFQILSRGVHKFEGTVNQYTGDGIMALFGAPIAHEDHAQRACLAALELRDELALYAEKLRRTKGLNFSVRMGLNSGEVIVGKIGDDLRMDYTAKGHTVGLAARMESLAAPDQVYLTQATASLVEGYFELRALGDYAIKGVSERLQVFELSGLGAFRSRLDASRVRGFSRFVGREQELQALESGLAEAAAGRGTTIGVVAEAGSGKSRLFYEFAESCRARGYEVIEAHCVAHGRMLPFLPVIELLRGYFKIGAEDSERSSREKIAGKLLLLDEGLKESVPYVFEFMGLTDPERPPPQVDAEIRRRLMFAAMEKMFCFDGNSRPELLVFEDLHWVDEGSEGVIGEIVDMLAGCRVLMLLNYRLEYAVPWATHPGFSEIALHPLGPKEIDALLLDLLGSDPSIDGFAQRVREHTGGNPFFTEEVVQALVDAGTLTGAKGAYRLGGPVSELILPPTVQGILGARIDRLPEAEKSLLETAAVFGKEFDEDVLVRLVGEAPDETSALLARLRDAGFLYELSRTRSKTWGFNHPLTQEVAYRSQLGEKRARVHLAVAEAFAELYVDHLDEFAALIAHHYDSAASRTQAARWRVRAAEHETGRDSLAALRHWSRLREIVGDDHDDAEMLRLALRSRIAILEESWKSGLPADEVQQLFDEGMKLAEICDCDHSRARLLAAMGMAKNFAGEINEASDYLKCALALTEAQGVADAEQLRLTLLGRLAYNNLLSGHLHESLALTERTVSEVAGRWPDARAFRAWPRMYTGDLRGAVSDLEAARGLVGTQNLPGSLGVIHGTYVTYAWFCGDADLAMLHAQAQFEIAERVRTVTMRVGARDSMGIALMMDRQWCEAVVMIEEAIAMVRAKSAMLQGEPVMLCNLSAAYLGAGETAKAIESALEGLRTARLRGTRMHQCRALLFHAGALLRGDVAVVADQVANELAEAMAIVEFCGAKAYEPFIREETARLARARGDREGWVGEIGLALAVFGEIGATGHEARLATEVRSEGIQAGEGREGGEKSALEPAR